MARRDSKRVARRVAGHAARTERTGRESGRKQARRSGDGSIPLGAKGAAGGREVEGDGDAGAGGTGAARDVEARFGVFGSTNVGDDARRASGDAVKADALSDDDLEPAEFVFGEDEEEQPGERRKEERWFDLVERKLASLPRPEGHDRRTWDGVFDRRTMMTLYKLLSNEMIDTLDFPISTGKEADVFRASTPEATYVCIKIFRTNTATFHDVLQYIQGDPRFKGIKPEKHGLVQAWAQKEYRNLGRAVDVGVRVPEPIACLDNVLVMEYVGTDEGPYAILKEVEVEDPEGVAEAILEGYHRMLVKGRLVHADISEYNVLWAGVEPVIIDVGQAVLVEHPMAEEFFERDVRNMARFMTRMGAPRTSDVVRARVLGDSVATFSELR